MSLIHTQEALLTVGIHGKSKLQVIKEFYFISYQITNFCVSYLKRSEFIIEMVKTYTPGWLDL